MNFDYEKQVGQKIRNLRKAKKMTQQTFVAQMQTYNCNITRSAYAKIEAGQRHIYLDEFKLIAELLEVDYSELL